MKFLKPATGNVVAVALRPIYNLTTREQPAMSFEEALATQPTWLRLWVLWMGVTIMVTFVALLFSKVTRSDALVIFITNVSVFLSMMWLHSQVGFVRLLGLVHVVFWTPLAFYLYGRLKNPAIDYPFRQIISVLLVTMLISLAFDYTDVVCYLLGERGSMVISN